eukprot:COSAG06_NODE_4729_length_3996_cov_11.246600_5_plen_161_part_00
MSSFKPTQSLSRQVRNKHIRNDCHLLRVRTVSLLPQSYFIGFVHSGINIQGGHEMLIDKCWLGETWCGAETTVPAPHPFPVPFAHPYTKMMTHLPRQTRDKCAETQKQRSFLFCRWDEPPPPNQSSIGILVRTVLCLVFHMCVPSLSWQTVLPFKLIIDF